MEKTVKLHVLAEKLGLETINVSTDYMDIELSNRNVNRPGIQLTGYMDEFPYKRIQIIGNVEYSYYMSLEPKERYERWRGILSYDIPCIIFSYNSCFHFLNILQIS